MKFLIVALVVLVSICSGAHTPSKMRTSPKKSPAKAVNLEWIVEQQKAKPITKRTHGCPADYCYNGGQCVELNEPTMTGHNFLCVCNGDFGGYRCGVARPCETCPANLGAVYCVRSAIESTGRYCYDKDYNMIDEAHKQNKRFWWLPLAAAGMISGSNIATSFWR